MPQTGLQSAGSSSCPRLTPLEFWPCRRGLAPSTVVRNGWSDDSTLHPAGSDPGTLAKKLCSEVPPQKLMCWGVPGCFSWTVDLSSSHNFRAMRSNPKWGSGLGMEPTYNSLSPSALPHCWEAHALSL